jgi:hypothetical protein
MYDTKYFHTKFSQNHLQPYVGQKKRPPNLKFTDSMLENLVSCRLEPENILTDKYVVNFGRDKKILWVFSHLVYTVQYLSEKNSPKERVPERI